MPDVGAKAPDFNLDGSDGKSHRLSEFKGKYLVLYFYPRDDTPGCTMEAKGFSSRLDDYEKVGAKVVGISDDDMASHRKFCDKYDLRLLLLSDPESKTIKAYDSYGDKGIFGMGTVRNTFIIGKDGKIAKVYKKVKPIGHEKEVLEDLRAMAK